MPNDILLNDTPETVIVICVVTIIIRRVRSKGLSINYSKARFKNESFYFHKNTN